MNKENLEFFKELAKRTVYAWESMDIRKVAEFFSKEPDLIYFDAAPLKYTGWQSYEEGSTLNFAKRFTHQKFWFYDDFVIRYNNNMAFAAFTIHLDVTPARADKIDADGRVTMIWGKKENDWLIVHEHLSIPGTLPPMVD